MDKFEKHYINENGQYYLIAGRVICKDNKELFSVDRHGYNLTPCQCDVMAHFIVDTLNNGNFQEYYKEYLMAK